MYYLYHIPGVKIGVTTNLEERVENQQGYIEGEYDVIMSSEDIDRISEWEIKFRNILDIELMKYLIINLNLIIIK